MVEPGNVETIVAIATPPGRGAIGIVRVSGPLARAIALEVCGTLPKPRVATYRSFQNATGETVDIGLVLFFPGPGSFTGEDSVEFQGHGSPGALRALVSRCVGLGARMARPGEFTERAFLNGRLDLSQAEAVADLIDSDSQEAAVAAARSLSGEFSRKVNEFCQEIRSLRTLVEAAIDFPEEEIDVLREYDVKRRIAEAVGRVEQAERAAQQGRLLHDGFTLVLLGEPNVGKSSLLNKLAEEDVAIVTDIPGTTRDVVRADIVVGGVPVTLVDTAGLRATDDPVERMGISRTNLAAGKADVGLIVVDARASWPDEAARISSAAGFARRVVVIRNKIDLSGEPAGCAVDNGVTVVSICARSGAGVDLLRAEILKAAKGGGPSEGGVWMARERHLIALAAARERLRCALLAESDQTDILAEDLAGAERCLEEIGGRRVTEDLLGDIFSKFCIGK